MTEIEKPWGKEEILEINKRYMFKRLTMKKGIDVVFSTIILNMKQYIYLKVN